MNFHYAISLAQTLYDVEGDMEDLEEIGLVAYNFIGNKNTQLHKEMLNVDCKTGEIQLPCGVQTIEAVTYCGIEDGNRVIENYIESGKAFLDPYYISGQFVKYKKVGDKLYVNKGLGKVIVLYHRELLDEDGLPEINDKEAIAIAEYIAYVQKYKEAIKTNNKYVLQQAQDLRQQWLFHCDAARVPIYINQNEMDNILDAQSAWGRKMYGRSFKPTL